MKMTTAAETYFEQTAGAWDALRATYFTEAVRDAAMERAYLRPEWTVADVGGGTGFMAAGLAPSVARVYLADGSQAMLDVARHNLNDAANVEYALMIEGRIPLPDDTVDVAFANMYLHHCTDPAAAIAEMARIVRPGGRLVITDMEAHDHAWMRDEMADEWPGFAREQVQAWLKDAGLVNTYVSYTGQSCCSASEATPDDQVAVKVILAVGTKRIGGAREDVQASYGAAAERQSECGCGTDSIGDNSDAMQFVADIPLNSACCCEETPAEAIEWRPGYSADELGAAPQEAAAFKLGCGNPTAIASLQSGEMVVDIGSGGGLDAFLSAQRVGPQGHVIGVDMTPQMLERAQDTARRNGFANVEFRRGHAEALPIEDQTADVIMSNCVINLCEDKGRVFEEAFRVLRVGGRLSVSDVVTSGAFAAEAQRDPTLWSGCVSGALPEQEYVALVDAAGFSDIHVERTASRGRQAGVDVYSVTVSARR
jgi:arsenite methyltransferase